MAPLVYIHRGYSWYVPYALSNGKRFVKDVFFLGDGYGCAVAAMAGVNTRRISSLSSTADEFAKIYQHHSELGYEFELICIQRWFVLLELMKSKGWDSCLYLDTDILVTQSLDELRAQTLAHGLTFCGYSAHSCFVNRRSSLEAFCQFVTDVYSKPENDSRLKSFHAEKVAEAGGGGVSDMTLFYWFWQGHPEHIASYEEIFDDSPFDTSLDDVRGFKADENGFKILNWENGLPSATSTCDKKISLATLHHQGRAKAKLIENFNRIQPNARLSSISVRLFDIVFKTLRKLRLIKN